MLLFGRLLRRAGLRVTSAQLAEVIQSLAWIDIGSREDVRNAARCILISRHEDAALFDRAFDAFWRRRMAPIQEPGPNLIVEEVPSRSPETGEPVEGGSARDGNRPRRLDMSHMQRAQPGEDPSEGTVLALYSAQETLRHKDFSHFTRNELTDAQRFLTEMQWTVAMRRSLRVRAARRGKRLDVRRSLRRSLRHGGELLDLARRGPKMKRRQLVLLCDVSGSMDRYTRLFLHFVHSVEASLQRVEVFVFGTRLTRITQELQHRDPDAAMSAVTSSVQDWSGGTRIGESLRTFNRRWARRVLGHGAIVVIISDGWDRGDPELLAAEMERLQRASYRLLWLNPLLGSSSYEPLTQGIRAALPYVDDFLPIHNLASLEALAVLLNDVQEGRPPRKQVRRRPRTQVAV